MSNALLNLVWLLQLEPLEKFTLVALADRANDSGECWPGISNVMARTCTSRRTVQRSISRLEAAGHLTRIQVPGKGCRYLIHPRHTDAPPAPEGRPTRATQTPHPRHTDAQYINEPSEEPSREPSLSARADHRQHFDCELALRLWNEVAAKCGLSQVRTVSGKRLADLKAALAAHDLDDWREAMQAIADSDFLLGRKTGWQVTLGWLTDPKRDNFARVRDGEFDNGPDPKADAFTRQLNKELGREPSRILARNRRRKMRSDFHPDQLLPVPPEPEFAECDIPF